MAALGITRASKLIEVVGSDVVRDVCSILGYASQSQLDDVKDTITTIRQVLLDTESKDVCHEVTNCIQKLIDAIYEADDLFDEVLTLAEQKQHNKDSKLREKVRNFFSSKKNFLTDVYSTSQMVKNIRMKLDSTVSSNNDFGFSVDSQSIREGMEALSYEYREEAVGREDDVDNIVRMLLDSDSQENISFISIVGSGGLGKTTLAQLVFDDERIKNEFPLRLWTCVSDQNEKDFNVNRILRELLESVSYDRHVGYTKDSVHSKFGDLLGGKKYLIVLDDVWCEDRNKWLDLQKYLMVGRTRSRVLVTTRSKKTALVADYKFKYELNGLSRENSWRLFEMTAFGENGKGKADENISELVEIGKEIVENCSNVPLAIRVVGTLLYGQNQSMWRSILECGLVGLNNRGCEIMSILKLSYDNLESPLKACFTYCSLFPKGFKIKKDKLIRLWIAQGYVVPFHVGQSLDEAAEEYVLILVRRCFFQCVKTNEIGGIESFRIHDLFHDVARKAARKVIVTLDSITSDLGNSAHHVFHVESKCEGSFFRKGRIRSYVRNGFETNFPVVKLVENWNYLRTLDLHDLDIQALPESIGKLLHLRYLDLSNNRRLRQLPRSLTKLYNLQTLDLNCCLDLRELPKDLAKLVNLRHLDISRCNELKHMPSGLDKLSFLSVLTQFVVGGKNIRNLENLRTLTNLRGSIKIRTTEKFENPKTCSKFVEGNLRRLKHLETLTISLSSHENHETFLKKLKPPSSVKELELFCYKAPTLPRWGGDRNLATLLPNLVRIILWCPNMVHLPSLSKLLHLKSLSLDTLKLEYMEDIVHETDAFTFFPSLEYLDIQSMNELKGWWKNEEATCNVWQPSFNKLSVLVVYNCCKLDSFPCCPRLEKLTLDTVNKELQTSFLGTEERMINLRELQIDNIDYLKSFCTKSLTTLSICENGEIESFSELEETIFDGCTSLRTLRIEYCNRLRSLGGGGWKHLTTLESIVLRRLPISVRDWDDDNNENDNNDEEIPSRSFAGYLVSSLKFLWMWIMMLPKGMQYLASRQNLELEWCNDNDGNDDDDDWIPWSSLAGNLQSLKIYWMWMTTLPKGMQYLASLQNLELEWCTNLESLPEWISCLSSLRSLRINECEKLRSLPRSIRDLTSLQLLQVRGCPLVAERFQDLDEDDWLNLRHIPVVEIRAD